MTTVAELLEFDPTIQQQSDMEIWQKYNIVLQGVAELIEEHGHAGKATRTLRMWASEACRRGLFAWSVAERKPTDDQLWTWYEILKQLVEGWPDTEGAGGQYKLVIETLKERGHKMPKQSTDMMPLDMAGDIII